jgi:hypothetical protein
MSVDYNDKIDSSKNLKIALKIIQFSWNLLNFI